MLPRRNETLRFQCLGVIINIERRILLQCKYYLYIGPGTIIYVNYVFDSLSDFRC